MSLYKRRANGFFPMHNAVFEIRNQVNFVTDSAVSSIHQLFSDFYSQIIILSRSLAEVFVLGE